MNRAPPAPVVAVHSYVVASRPAKFKHVLLPLALCVTQDRPLPQIGPIPAATESWPAHRRNPNCGSGSWWPARLMAFSIHTDVKTPSFLSGFPPEWLPYVFL